MMCSRRLSLGVGILVSALAIAGSGAAPDGAHALDREPGTRAARVPSKVLAVPTDVSPELQQLIAAPLNPDWDARWSTGAEWRKAADALAARTAPERIAMQRRLQVTVTPGMIAGVRVFTVKPAEIPPAHRDKLLLHLHGGCYVLYPGESGTTEAVLMAALGHYTVISVDYRMPPEGYFPAALEDAFAVYRELIKTRPPRHLAVFGTSAGGALTLELMLRARQTGVPLPAAIAPGTPMADVTHTGDSLHTNEYVDNVLVSESGFCGAATMVYAQGHRLDDPLLSPIYGDLGAFPPAILTSGTRDLLLSNTVRVHRKLRNAGVEAQLQVFEGMSHAQYQMDDRVPEDRDAFREITAFFDRHFGR